MEAIVPEEEITYFGWRGCGYILYDPETGAGACLITGGAAGAEILEALGEIIDLLTTWFEEEKALIVEGENRLVVEIKKGITNVLRIIFAWIRINIAKGATFLLGYCPIYKRICSPEKFLQEVGKTEYKILYHTGTSDSLSLDLDIEFKRYEGLPEPVITVIDVSADEIKEINTSHFKFVYLSGCKTAGTTTTKTDLHEAFKSKCFLGYTKRVNPFYTWNGEIWFWAVTIVFNLSVKKAVDFTLHKRNSDKWPAKWYGDGNTILRRW
jgi:hypothetical protein